MRRLILALLLVAGVASAADMNAPVGWWKFDEGQGTTVADSSGNNNNGKFVGGVTWATGVSGGALQFNGSDSWVEVPASASMDLTNLTMAAWVNMETLGGMMCFSVGGSWNDERAVLHFYDGQTPHSGSPMFTVSNGATYVTTREGSVLPLNKWTHVAATYDGKTMTVYINGLPVATVNNAEVPPVTKGVSFKIGRTEGLNPDFFAGKIDDVRVYNRALTAADIKALVETSPKTK